MIERIIIHKYDRLSFYLLKISLSIRLFRRRSDEKEQPFYKGCPIIAAGPDPSPIHEP
jgi:hypothetical protein